ncbi:MAG: helix-turn-helix domain-containing protein [Acidobacteriaceae bacterium]
MAEQLWKVPEAAPRLGVARQTLWNWVGSRKIGVYRIGRSVRIPESEVQRILAESFVPAREDR